jgi:hypothetical protein
MKLLRILTVKTSLVILLTAAMTPFLTSCGGGGGDSSANPLPPTVGSASTVERSTSAVTSVSGSVSTPGVMSSAPVAGESALTGAPTVAVTSGGTTGSQVYFTPAKIAESLAASPDQWRSARAHFHGVWMNGAGSTVDSVPMAIGLLDLNTIPTILPAACGLSADKQTAVCDSDSSLRRMNTSNRRLASAGKVLVATDRVFNLNDVLRKIPTDTLIQNLKASKQQVGFEGIRMGILVHPGDGNEGTNIEETRKVIDAVDAGGVVAIEISPSLMGSRIFLQGSAAIWKYAQSKGKRAVWLMNGPATTNETTPEDVLTNWIERSKSAQDYLKSEHNLTLDVLAPIATRGADTLLPTLGEGDGKWPPQRTFMSWVLSLMGLNGWLI